MSKQIQQILQSEWFLEQVGFSHIDRYSRWNPSSWSIFVNVLAVTINLSKLNFSYDKYSVDKVWMKIYCQFYFRGITLTGELNALA